MKFNSHFYLYNGLIFLLFYYFTGCAKEKHVSAKQAVYEAQINEWHRQRITRLTSKTGWLSLAGLYWLREGQNTFGSSSSNDIQFPEGKSPAYIGSFYLESDVVRVEIKKGINVLSQGHPVKSAVMQPDVSGNRTILHLDSLDWFIIKRGERYAVRLRDRENTNITNFKGIERFPIDTTWRVMAKLEYYRPAKKIEIPNIIGTITEENSPGVLVFTISGNEYRLDPISEDGAKSLFLIFADQTNGIETYGAGRFLSVEMPSDDGLTTVDFNKAYNPPCAFTPWATCPLPPPQNVLPIPVTAGEKKYGEH